MTIINDVGSNNPHDPSVRHQRDGGPANLAEEAARHGSPTEAKYTDVFDDAGIKEANALALNGNKVVAQEAEREAKADFNRLTRREEDKPGSVYKPDIKDAERAIEVATQKRVAVTGYAQKATSESKVATTVLNDLNAFLRGHSDGKPLKAVSVKLAAGVSEIAVVAAERERQDNVLQPKRKAIIAAPRTLEEALADAVAQIDAGCLPRYRERNGKVTAAWPVALVAAEPSSGGVVPHVNDLMPALLAIGRDVFVAKAKADLQAQYAEIPLALSDKDKAAALAEIDAEILASHRREAEAIWQAKAKGVDIDFRAGTHPAAILGLEA